MANDDDADDSWFKTLRKFLPLGAPLLTEDQLDSSIGVGVDADPPNAETVTVPDSPLSRSGRLSSAVRSGKDSDCDASSPRVSSVGSEPVKAEQEEGTVIGAPIRGGRRGACSRCKKGSVFNFRDREACLVCDARYCSNCIVKAMGSMPEGRKCVVCIGHPINETKRASLGKRSRLLSKVCRPLEVGQIMKAERECPTNQVRPYQLILNGQILSQEERDQILGCPNPPDNLRPGSYWYDKDLGFWGKVKNFILVH